VVEGAPLLREYTRKGIVGSNPIFSAIRLILEIFYQTRQQASIVAAVINSMLHIVGSSGARHFAAFDPISR
jgi:hypothetical protein